MTTAADEIKMHLSKDPSAIDPIWSTDLIDIGAWCLYYHRYCKYKCDVLKRFAIGFYQIHQGMEWAANESNKNESYAAAFLHLLMVAEVMELPIEDHLGKDVLSYPAYEETGRYQFLLIYLSRVQQQLFYGIAQKTQRKSRYNKEKITRDLSAILYIFIAFIETSQRKQALYDASRIMTKELK